MAHRSGYISIYIYCCLHLGSGCSMYIEISQNMGYQRMATVILLQMIRHNVLTAVYYTFPCVLGVPAWARKRKIKPIPKRIGCQCKICKATVIYFKWYLFWQLKTIHFPRRGLEIFDFKPISKHGLPTRGYCDLSIHKLTSRILMWLHRHGPAAALSALMWHNRTLCTVFRCFGVICRLVGWLGWFP